MLEKLQQPQRMCVSQQPKFYHREKSKRKIRKLQPREEKNYSSSRKPDESSIFVTNRTTRACVVDFSEL
jgi:hypothetical protein